MSRTTLQLTPLALLALVVGACEQTPVSLPEATSLVATPAQIQLIAGDMTAASAQVLDQRGNVLRGAEVSWSADAPGVARVSRDGMVTAVAPGSATLTASYGSLSAQVPVTVTRDERDLITALEIAEEVVTTDRRAGPQFVGFRAFDGRGRHRCDANFQFHSSDRSVATAGSAAGCLMQIEPVGPGEATITVSSNNISASLVVKVTIGGHIAFFAEVPAWNEIFAGNTVTYRVRVLDADDQPVAGHAVNFEASGGRLTVASVRTDDQGYAAVQWRLPQGLRQSYGDGDFDEAGIIFRSQLPGGAVMNQADHRHITPAPAATVHFYAISQQNWQWRINAVSGSIQVPVFTSAYIVAESRDAYGNRRDPWAIEFIVDGAPAFPHMQWLDGRYYRALELHGWESGTMTVTAREGEASASLAVTFTGSP